MTRSRIASPIVWSADNFMPSADGDLAGDQQRAFLVAIIDDFQQVASLFGGQWLRSPVVDDQQAGALQRCHEAREASFTAGRGQLGKQPWGSSIEHGQALAAGLVAQCAGQPRLPDAGWAADDQVLAGADPLAGGELLEQRAIEAAWRAIIGVLDHRAVPQSCLAQPMTEAFVFAARRLTIQQQAKPVLA